jgi:hypothetical protein
LKVESEKLKRDKATEACINESTDTSDTVYASEATGKNIAKEQKKGERARKLKGKKKKRKGKKEIKRNRQRCRGNPCGCPE